MYKRKFGPHLPSSYKKKKAKAKPSLGVSSQRANTFKTILKYAENFSLNPGPAGVTAVRVFSANGLFDPDITGAGHQPVGFDQYMGLYGEYVVTKATMVAKFFNADTNEFVNCGIYETDLTSTNPDQRVYLENGRGVWDMAGRIGDFNNPLTLVKTINIRDAAGTNVITDPEYTGNDSSNPAEQQYFQVWAAPGNGTGDPGNVWVTVVISYEVMFRNMKLTGLS